MLGNNIYSECLRLYGRDWKEIKEIGDVMGSGESFRFIVYFINSKQNYVFGSCKEEVKEGRKLFKKFIKQNINLNK